MANSGQVCIAVKRCYVPRSKYDEYIEAFKAAAEKMVIGNGMDEGTTMHLPPWTMGPLNNGKMQPIKNGTARCFCIH